MSAKKGCTVSAFLPELYPNANTSAHFMTCLPLTAMRHHHNLKVAVSGPTPVDLGHHYILSSIRNNKPL
jgi:hypothetical protein